MPKTYHETFVVALPLAAELLCMPKTYHET